MHYVYILQSQKDGSKYIGYSLYDPNKRLTEHNSGMNNYSIKHRPFELAWFCCFQSKSKALNFEKYLKHGSGHAFMNKRLV